MIPPFSRFITNKKRRYTKRTISTGEWVALSLFFFFLACFLASVVLGGVK